MAGRPMACPPPLGVPSSQSRRAWPGGAAGAGGTLAMLTYSMGGGAGSREHSLTVITSPISPESMPCEGEARARRGRLGRKAGWTQMA